MDPYNPTQEEERICAFVHSYLSKFNDLRSELEAAGDPFRLYAKKIVTSVVIFAADGVVVLYYPDDARSRFDLELGVILEDHHDESVGHYLQSISGNQFKVLGMEAGQKVDAPQRMPPDLPPEQLFCTGNPAVMRPLVESGLGAVFPAMAVSPVWDVKLGLLTRIVPSRNHVFTPPVPIHGSTESGLLFAYPFLDIFWRWQELDLSDSVSDRWARSDVDVLKISLGAAIPSARLVENPFDSVAEHCELVCNRLRGLIYDPNSQEEDVQRFLERPAHQFLIAPSAKRVLSQHPIGHSKYKLDFVVQRSDGDYHLIEIENPQTPIYTKGGAQMAAVLTHALQQVKDWINYIREYRSHVREQDGLPGINFPTGQVIMGREDHLFSPEAKTRFDSERANNQISITTYDMLIEQGRAYAASLRRTNLNPR